MVLNYGLLGTAKNDLEHGTKSKASLENHLSRAHKQRLYTMMTKFSN